MSSEEEKIEFEVTSASNASIKFHGTHEKEQIEAGMELVIPVLMAYLRGRKICSMREMELPENRLRAILSVELLAKHKLHESTSFFASISDLVIGEKTASDFGFPEFDDETDPNWDE